MQFNGLKTLTSFIIPIFFIAVSIIAIILLQFDIVKIRKSAITPCTLYNELVITTENYAQTEVTRLKHLQYMLLKRCLPTLITPFITYIYLTKKCQLENRFYKIFNILFGFSKSDLSVFGTFESNIIFFIIILYSVYLIQNNWWAYIIMYSSLHIIVAQIFINHKSRFFLPSKYFPTLFSLVSILLEYFMLLCISESGKAQQITIEETCANLINKHFDKIVTSYSLGNIFVGCTLFFTKLIFIYSGQITSFTKEELIAIIYHEIGHGGKSGLASVLFRYLLISHLVDWIGTSFFSKIATNISGSEVIFLYFLNFPMLYNVKNLFINYANYEVEYRADNLSKTMELAKDLILGIKKIHDINGVPNRINWVANLLLFAHPCLYNRVVRLASD